MGVTAWGVGLGCEAEREWGAVPLDEEEFLLRFWGVRVFGGEVGFRAYDVEKLEEDGEEEDGKE